MIGRAPYRIETERLVLRCYEPEDAPLLKDAVDSSLEHLRAWMPWAPDAPEPLDDVVDRLRLFRSAFDRDENFIMGIFTPDDARLLGGTGLHPRIGDDGLEIGYWIRADAIGQGYATESSAALTRVAIEVCGVDRVEIRVDPANERSLRVPRKLGFTEEATLRRRLPDRRDSGPRDVVVFSMFASDLPSSPCASFTHRRYDVLAREL